MSWKEQLDSPGLVEATRVRIPLRIAKCKECTNFQGIQADDQEVVCKIGKVCCGGKVGPGILSLAWAECPEFRWCQTMFEKVYVVSLTRTPDRLTEFWRRMAMVKWPFKTPTVFEAMDGEILPTPTGVYHTTIASMRQTIYNVLPRVAEPGVRKIINDALSTVTDEQNRWVSGGGAWGCMESHRQILRNCIIGGVDSVLVLEDDAEPSPDFMTRLPSILNNLPPNWDGIMLGGQHFGPSPVEVAPGVVRVTNCQRTHAYALRGKLLKDVYAMWHSYFGHCDHALGPFLGKYNVYAPSPFLIGQGRNQSQITGRPEPTRFWSGADKKAKIILLHASRETVKLLRVEGLHTGYSRDPVSDVDSGLIKIFTSKESINNKVREIRNWYELIRREAVAFANGVCALWYPDLDQSGLQAIKLAAGSEFLELRIRTVDDYKEMRNKYGLSSN